MSLFNFRRAAPVPVPAAAASPAVTPESVEVMRKRARQRLIGAVVLVAGGVLGFPLLFDTQPRPIEVDIPIQIPDKNSGKPLLLPAAAGAVTPAVEAPLSAASLAAQEAIAREKTEKVVTKEPPEALKNEVKPAPKPKAVAKAEPAAQPKPPAKPAPKVERPINGSADSVRAMALLNGQNPTPKSAATSSGRIVLQVGAFADASKAQETRLKLEAAGLKTFTQVVDGRDGKRTRVRVGPFTNKAEADQAAAKIKQLGFSAAVLSL